MQFKHFPLILLLILALGAACTPLYTTDQVNATVSAKIKEVAAYQKINVTVETVILKEYIVVTPTLAPTVPQPLPYSTITPIGFNRYKPEDIFAQIELSGYQVRQFFVGVGVLPGVGVDGDGHAVGGVRIGGYQTVP